MNEGWALSFALAAAALLLIWWTVPGTGKLVIGKDGRWSTSKFQATAWTLVVVFALFSLFFAYLIVHVGDLFNWSWADRLQSPLGDSLNDFFDQGLDGTYLVLLGLPLGTAVASKAITQSKVANGTEVKPPKDAQDSTSAVQELVGDDNGETDLGDFQYLLFNFLALAYFLVQFVSDPSAGLPSLPDTLIALTGVSAAAYVAKKGIYKEPPILLGVLPPSGKPGDLVTVYGQKLIAAPNAGMKAGAAPGPVNPSPGVVVMIAGVAAQVEGTPNAERVQVRVPDIDKGPTKLSVLRPPGAESDQLPFSVLSKEAPSPPAPAPQAPPPSTTAPLPQHGGGHGQP
ncbi:MAG TPA: IPT/TIG domain-containing protein [Solirubrobacterales bacterium]|nr:IPT/TIG domain-containing protein [Solirubrobacterales bacterium]